MKYLVTAEVERTHSAVVIADNEDEAAEKYLNGEWESDLGDEEIGEGMVISVEEHEE
jgi:hypothetical protein